MSYNHMWLLKSRRFQLSYYSKSTN